MEEETMTAEAQVDNLVEEASAAPYHTILELWRGVLSPARQELSARITPQWANRIVASYQGVRFQDMGIFREKYFTHVLELADILDKEIESEPECLNMTSAEEDKEINTFHYLNLLVLWQQAFLLWELQWSYRMKYAGVELAAMSEVHKMFFGEQGILGLLDQIKFEFTETDQQMLVDVLNETRKEAESAG